MRINSYLAKCALGSRRSAEELVKNGSVFVNGAKMTNLAYQVVEEDVVEIDGKKVKPKTLRYFLVNKPVGYTSTVSDPHADKKVVDLVPERGLFPVGRLDKDSEGLMILTNDGDFAQKLIHPSNEHEREYLVQVKLPRENRSKRLEDALKFFKCGIRLDSKRTKPAKIKLLGQEAGRANFIIVLEEGMKRQIRRTFEKARLQVISLKRIRMADYKLGELKEGEWKRFNPSA